MTDEEKRDEREAICLEQPDVTPERARLIAECEHAAIKARAGGEVRECVCGLHPWGGV